MSLVMLLDKFSNFVGEQIINHLNQGGSVGVHAISSTQSLSDIVAKCGQSLQNQILNNLNNLNNFIILRQNYPQDAKTLASVLSTNNSMEVTSQFTHEIAKLPLNP
jgi:hypothetical protein